MWMLWWERLRTCGLVRGPMAGCGVWDLGWFIWLYVSVIRLSVTYASLVWWPGCQTASAMKKLSKIQRLACLGITGAVHTTSTHAMEALICLPPLELVVQGEARMAAHRLWSLGCWLYPYPNREHSSILKRLQQLYPVFSMGLDTMRPTYNLERKYRVTILNRENWTRGSGAPPEVKGLIWYTYGFKMKEGTRAGVSGQTVRRRLIFSLGRYKTVFQAEIYAILACVYEIQSQNRPEKYVSICSDSRAALKALQAVRTTFPLVHQCQKALNDISARHVVGLYWVPGHARVWGNEIADGLVRGGSALGFLGPEPVLGVSRRVIRKRLIQWLINQHWVSWRDLGNTQRQAQELILGPCLGFKVKFLSFNRTQSRVVTGLLNGHNALRRHFYLLGLIDSQLCRGRGVKEETSAYILCECEALASLSHVYLGSFFLEPEDIKSMSLGANWSFGRATALLWFCYGAQRAR